MRAEGRLIGRFMAVAMGVGVLAGTVAAPARAATGCDVVYTVTNAWQGGFQGSVTVKNTGDAWTSWSLRFSFPSGRSVTQGWGGTWTTGTSPTVANASYNGSVPTGGSLELGFIGSGAGSGSTPSSFSVNGTSCGGSVVAPTTDPGTPPTTRPPATPTTTAPSTGCATTPVDPQATQQAKNLLCYLYSVYGNHILSGQQESLWIDGPDYEMTYINRLTGKYPAIRGLDYGDSQTVGSRAVSWWNAGGIPMLGYHMGAPNQDTDGYSGSRMSANISAALTPGTADNRRLTARLDGVAGQLQLAQSAGVAVIFRPWHEAGGTWFWWSMEGGSQYQRLWRYTYDYMTRTKGLHNLVWLMPYNDYPNSAFNPGKAYYDLGGADTYARDHGPLTAMFDSAGGVFGSPVPIALHENGRIPDPSQLQSSTAKWVLFNTWHSSFVSDTSINPVSTFQSVYAHPYVITRDEVPDLG